MSLPLIPASHSAGLAFDRLAEHYDEVFTESHIGRTQRDAVWSVMHRTFLPGARILELNCGTGEDALSLARRGITVLACDASAGMIAVANRRCAQEVPSPSDKAQFKVLPTEKLVELQPLGRFDGVLSNFSGFNCVADIPEAARQLSMLVKTGAPMLLCLSTRICLWEVLWFVFHGQFTKAFRRWKGHASAKIEGIDVTVSYPILRSLKKSFAPWFTLRSCIGIGVTVPPSYVERWVRRHPGLLRALTAVDKVVCRWPLFRVTGDHMLLVLERTAS